jgi:hypothetical protein
VDLFGSSSLRRLRVSSLGSARTSQAMPFFDHEAEIARRCGAVEAEADDARGVGFGAPLGQLDSDLRGSIAHTVVAVDHHRALPPKMRALAAA